MKASRFIFLLLTRCQNSEVVGIFQVMACSPLSSQKSYSPTLTHTIVWKVLRSGSGNGNPLLSGSGKFYLLEESRFVSNNSLTELEVCE